MENKIRFRNHISVILEQLGATFGILFVLSFTNIDDVIDYIEKGSSEELSLTVYIGGGVILAVFLLIFLYQWIIWSKTYISICDNSIVIERNTWNKKKNTIGLKNISNVNTEQNLLEMLLGTCKVKLDTNSMSTSDKTDVKIILKKAEAEQFRLYVMKLMQGQEGEGEIFERRQRSLGDSNEYGGYFYTWAVFCQSAFRIGSNWMRCRSGRDGSASDTFCQCGRKYCKNAVKRSYADCHIQFCHMEYCKRIYSVL